MLCKFLPLAVGCWLTSGDPSPLRLGNSNKFDCSRLNRGVGLPLATRPYSDDKMQQSTEEGRAKFVKADTEVATRKNEIDKLIERYGAEINLTQQQIKRIKNNIALAWSKFGVNTAINLQIDKLLLFLHYETKRKAYLSSLCG